MPTKRTIAPSVPFRAAVHLRSDAEIAAYIEAMLADGDARAVPIALRTVAKAVGGMGALAEKTGLSREAIYRTLSASGNPRLDTLALILEAFGLRLSVTPAPKPRRTEHRTAHRPRRRRHGEYHATTPAPKLPITPPNRRVLTALRRSPLANADLQISRERLAGRPRRSHESI